MLVVLVVVCTATVFYPCPDENGTTVRVVKWLLLVGVVGRLVLVAELLVLKRVCSVVTAMPPLLSVLRQVCSSVLELLVVLCLLSGMTWLMSTPLLASALAPLRYSMLIRVSALSEQTPRMRTPVPVRWTMLAVSDMETSSISFPGSTLSSVVVDDIMVLHALERCRNTVLMNSSMFSGTTRKSANWAIPCTELSSLERMCPLRCILPTSEPAQPLLLMRAIWVHVWLETIESLEHSLSLVAPLTELSLLASSDLPILRWLLTIMVLP